MYQESNVYNALPKLPGYDLFNQLNQPHKYEKSHSLDLDQGARIVKNIVPHPGIINANALGSGGVSCFSPSSSSQKVGSGVIGGNDTGYLSVSGQPIPPTLRPIGIPKEQIMDIHPQWKSLMNKACRYFAYFTEKIADSQIEKFRVRKVALVYNLYDATVMVSETPAVINSGIPSGVLIKRHWEPSCNLETLRIGSTVILQGLTFNIVDCDGFTRQFCSEMGIEQPPPLGYPEDAHETLQMRPLKVIDEEGRRLKTVNESLAASASGKTVLFMTDEEREKARNFYAHDREVLNFFATWEHRHFRISYYLVDGAIQVSCLHAPNDGRDQHAAFIRRGRFPREEKPALLNQLETLTPASRQEFYTDQDLQTGKHILLLNRDFYVYDCDEFTRRYYKDKYNLEMTKFEKPKTEGDALGRRPYLHREKEKKLDLEKFFNHADDVLRFAAEISDPSPEDEGRQFIVCYYLADDTVQVMEFIVDNSGHTGGRIFRRSSVAGLKPTDFYVGAKLEICAHTYILTEMDERTKRFIETGISIPCTVTNPQVYVKQLRSYILTKFSKYTQAYRYYNPCQQDSAGLTVEQLKKMFEDMKIRQPPPDMLNAVFAELDVDRDGVISLQEFIEQLLDGGFGIKKTKHAAPETEDYVAEQTLSNTRAVSNVEGERVLRAFVNKLEAKKAFVIEAFRLVSDAAVDGRIGAEEFRDTVKGSRLNMGLTDKQLQALTDRFFHNESQRLTFKEFRHIVESIY